MSVLYFYISILVSKEIHCGGSNIDILEFEKVKPLYFPHFSPSSLLHYVSTVSTQFPYASVHTETWNVSILFIQLILFPSNPISYSSSTQTEQQLYSLYLSVCTYKTYICTYIMLDNISQVQEDEDLMFAFIYGI
jgi:hypothetical protein